MHIASKEYNSRRGRDSCECEWMNENIMSIASVTGVICFVTKYTGF